jgi:hypothetical protein
MKDLRKPKKQLSKKGLANINEKINKQRKKLPAAFVTNEPGK